MCLLALVLLLLLHRIPWDELSFVSDRRRRRRRRRRRCPHLCVCVSEFSTRSIEESNPQLIFINIPYLFQSFVVEYQSKG